MEEAKKKPKKIEEEEDKAKPKKIEKMLNEDLDKEIAERLQAEEYQDQPPKNMIDSPKRAEAYKVEQLIPDRPHYMGEKNKPAIPKPKQIGKGPAKAPK